MKYLISQPKVYEVSEHFTIHRQFSLLESCQDVIKVCGDNYHKFGKSYLGMRSLRDRVRFGISVGEEFVIDDRLLPNVRGDIENLVKKEYERVREVENW